MNNENILLIEKAFNLYGEKEKEGKGSNPIILDIIQSGLPWANDDSTTAWCALFMRYLFEKSGLSADIPSKPASARSWLNVGVEVSIEEDTVHLGDLVVFWRGRKNGWKGHVALYIRHTDTHIYVLGGNQSDSINITSYRRSRLLGIRRILPF